MSKHSLYLAGELDKMVQDYARRLGIKPAAAIRLKLEAARLQESVDRMERKVDALFLLLEVVLPELGFAAGATRSVSAKVEAAQQEGRLLRDTIELALKRLRAEFKEQKEGLL